MIRTAAGLVFVVFMYPGAAFAQSFATYEQPGGLRSPYTPSPDSPFAIQPASSYDAPLDSFGGVYSVPVYDAYEQGAFDVETYRSALGDATAPLPSEPVLYQEIPASAVADVEAIGTANISVHDTPLPVGYGAAPVEPPFFEDNGFQTESETSRILFKLEETHRTRVSALKRKHLEQRRFMLDQFEKDAADPAKVIGLAGRMRTALSELDASQQTLLELEEQKYTEAMLSVLDASPSRLE